MSIPFEDFDIADVKWPAPRPEPKDEIVDHHLGPLDDDEDRIWLNEGDPRLRGKR
jgi:hypothetical protein